MEWAHGFAEQNGKELLILLSYGSRNVIRACRGEPRFDRTFVDFLNRGNYRVVDALQKHAVDFAAFNLTPEQYARRYYHGHYNPAGNLFFADAITDAVVDWLVPPPVTYLAESRSVVEAAGILAE